MTETTFITDPAELGAMLSLPAPEVTEALAVGESLPLRIPRKLVERITKGNPDDPILSQFWPKKQERLGVPGFTDDPLGEFSAPNAVSGERLPTALLWKYAGRVLVMTRGACAANCRFCFRRHLPQAAPPDWKEIASFLENHKEIEEVILSGGDPLGLPPRQLETAFHYIGGLSFVKRVRIHTRYPILLPSRLTQEMLRLLEEVRKTGKNLPLVFHINHPAELASDTTECLRTLNERHFPLFSQTVLLRGVNDRASILKDLFTKEFRIGVIPYYLHQLDRVAGAAHFEVPVSEGLAILDKLRQDLPGYLVPRYVREQAGVPSKLSLG
jgi:EF-P beta-lysylation protein EpmB